MRPVFLTTENFANPYPLAQWLRDNDPVHWSTEFHAWLLTRYADVSACLHDPRLASDRVPPVEQMGPSMQPLLPLFRTMRRMFLYRDAPEHTRMRRAVHQTFTRAAVERWRTEIQRLVGERLDAIEGQEEADLLSALARPLPITVIRMVLGIPAETAARLEVWSEDVSRFVGNFSHPPDRLAAIQRSILEFSDYLRTLIEERRREPDGGADLLSVLTHGPEPRLSDDEIVANAILLVAAGHVTTTDLIGNGTLALLRHPDCAAELRERAATPMFMESAVEELLRCESPVQMTTRVARADVEIAGKTIRTGDWLMLWLGAANRDPLRFQDPDRLLLTRTDNRHLSFGSGAHFCIGAPLARLQAQIALPALFKRFPALQVSEAPLVWEEQPALRGLKALPLRLRA